MNPQTQTQALQKANPQKPSALNLMASRLSVDANKLLETLKSTVFQKATNEELLSLVTVANEYGLNPFLKEMYAFPAKGGGIVPVVSVDGWNKMLLRQPEFDGIEFEILDKEDGTPHSCTATVYIKTRSRPVKITEYFDECKRNTDPWNNMPRRMLRNRTLCQASRIAFGFSGIYNDDEALDVEATVMPSQPPPKLVTSGGSNADAGQSPTPEPSTGSKSACDELQCFVLAGGFTFDHLKAWGEETKRLDNADSLTGFDDISDANAKRLLRIKSVLLDGLAEVKGRK